MGVIKNVLMTLEGFIASAGLATSWWTCLPVKVSLIAGHGQYFHNNNINAP